MDEFHPKQLLQDTTRDLIKKACGGNPGSLRVLLEVFKEFGEEVNPLCIAVLMTNTPAHELWVVYADFHAQDVKECMKTFRRWYNNSTETLGEWTRRNLQIPTGGRKAGG